MQVFTTGTLTPTKTILVYGPTGSGKTRLITTATNPFIASTDAGLRSIRRWNLPYTVIRSAAEFAHFLSWAKGETIAEGLPPADSFTTLCIDDLSELAHCILQEQLPKHKDARQAYGVMAETVMQFCRELRDFPTDHLIYCTAKLDRIQDMVTGGLIYAPLFPGKVISPHIPYIFDELYYLNAETDLNTGVFSNGLLTRRTSQYEAKTRSDNLDTWEVPANLTNVFNKIAQG